MKWFQWVWGVVVGLILVASTIHAVTIAAGTTVPLNVSLQTGSTVVRGVSYTFDISKDRGGNIIGDPTKVDFTNWFKSYPLVGTFTSNIEADSWGKRRNGVGPGFQSGTVTLNFDVGDVFVMYIDHTQDPEFTQYGVTRNRDLMDIDGKPLNIRKDLALKFSDVFYALKNGVNYVTQNVNINGADRVVRINVGGGSPPRVTTDDLNGLINYTALQTMLETGVPTYNFVKAKILIRYFVLTVRIPLLQSDYNTEFHWTGSRFDTQDFVDITPFGSGTRAFEYALTMDRSIPKASGKYTGKLTMALVGQ